MFKFKKIELIKMRSYKELIKDDTFRTEDEYFEETVLTKMCWSCETNHKSGHKVYDTSKMRRIFFCEECYTKLKN